MTRYFLRILSAALFTTMFSAPIEAQQYPSPVPLGKFWSADSYVESTILSADRRTLYLGGSFRYLRSDDSGAFAFSTTSGAIQQSLPIIEGDVHAIISDGNGGWYLGGNFIRVGDEPRVGLAHITASNQVRTTFAPQITIGTVYSLALHNNSLYVGGDFTAVNGEERLRLAAFDAVTGSLLPWNPAVTANTESPAATIYSMVVDPSGSSLYVGGRLTGISGAARRGIARFDLPSGQLSSWAPTLGPSYEPGVVFALAFDASQQAVFAGGYFRAVNDAQTSYHLTALRASDGEKLPAWTAGIVGTVYALALDTQAQRLYLGGSLSTVGGQARTGLAAVNPTSGALLTWNPVVSSNIGTAVRTIQLDTQRNTLYVGGRLNGISGEPRIRFAAVDTSIGTATALSVPIGRDTPGTARKVTTIALSPDRGRVILGGENLVLEHRRNCLAALDVETGLVTDWNPDLRGGLIDDPNRPDLARINTMALHHASGKLYVVATGVRYFGGQDLGFRRLFSIDITTGAPGSWSPEISSPSGVSSSIRSLLVDNDNDHLYIGGTFASANGQARRNLVRYRLTDQSLDSWDPQVGQIPTLYYSDSVSALELDNDAHLLYVGGYFRQVGSFSRKRLAAVSTITGQPISWRPNLAHPGDIENGRLYGTHVSFLLFDRGRQSLFVGFGGGEFAYLNVANQLRHGFAEISTVNDELVYPGNPLAGFRSPYVSSMARDEQSNLLYVGGHFNSVSGEIADRRSLLSFDLSTRQLTPWQPIGTGDSVGTYGNLWVGSLQLDPVQGVLYTGGSFSSFSGVPKRFVAAFQLRESPPLCPADFDGDGQLSTADLFTFLAAFFARDMRADFDGSGTVATPDIFAFLNIWFEGC